MTPLKTQLEAAAFLAARRRAFNWSQPRTGKEQPADSIVMTPQGEIPISRIIPGDIICHPFKGTTRVKNVFPQGIKPVFSVEFRDGSTAECGEEHLWSVRDEKAAKTIEKYGSPYRTRTLKNMILKGLLTSDQKPRFKIPNHNPVFFEALTPNQMIHPYVLGVLIGDGSLSGGEVLLSVPDRDRDIVRRVQSLMPSITMNLRRMGPNVSEARLSLGKSNNCNDLVREIKRLGLNIKSAHKFIPRTYLLSSIKDRTELLRGLMDTDGSCGLSGSISPLGITRKTGATSFSTKSVKLARDIAWLVRSLGGIAVIRGHQHYGETELSVGVQVSFCPFHTIFKKDRWSAITHPSAKITRGIVSAHYVRDEEQFCIEIEASDGLYLTNDFLTTHNTGAAILAADSLFARTILVVTTASGRGVWRRAFPAWSDFRREVRVLGVDAKEPGETEVAIVSWDSLSALASKITARPDLLILDEDQRATNPDTNRARHAYGRPVEGGLYMLTRGAVVQPEDRVWHLSGLPMPHDLGQAWPRLRASFPERLSDEYGPTDVTRYDAFRIRYCVVRTKQLSNFSAIPVVFGGRNVSELRSRLNGTFIRHTMLDVGIAEPRYEIMPLVVSGARRRECDGDLDQRRVIEAAERGSTRDLEMELGTLRRVTGTIKAAAVIDAAKEEFANGIEKLVLAYWHRDVGDALELGLRHLGVLRLDGSTGPRDRETLESRWRQKKYGIFLAQIKAAGEAIDLSAAREMWCVETSLSPGDMDQISKRIVNVEAVGPALIRVATLEGTIDEILQEILLRLWAPIREVLK